MIVGGMEKHYHIGLKKEMQDSKGHPPNLSPTHTVLYEYD